MAITVREQLGLTDFYNALDEGAWDHVGRLHVELDTEVLRAYGLPATLREDPLELKARLAAMHAEISGRHRRYEPFV